MPKAALAFLLACSPWLAALPVAAAGDAPPFDPWAYCLSVKNADTVDDRHLGKHLPPALVGQVRIALGLSAEMPEELLRDGTTWRCMDGQVWACHVGANLPCGAKADTSRQPGAGTADYCREHPDDDVVPAYVTGHETVFEWRCRSGKPYVARQLERVDQRGFQASIWSRVDPPRGKGVRAGAQ